MTRTTLAVLIAGVLAGGSLEAAQPTEVKAFFRDGQTFLTWKEDAASKGETYRVYRAGKPLTTAGLPRAKMVLEVREGSSTGGSRRGRASLPSTTCRSISTSPTRTSVR